MRKKPWKIALTTVVDRACTGGVWTDAGLLVRPDDIRESGVSVSFASSETKFRLRVHLSVTIRIFAQKLDTR